MRQAPRIVSLLPGATEIVCALGLREALVGISHECDHPADVAGLPVVTAPRIDVDGSSREIDRDLRALVVAGLGVYQIDADRLRALEPDLIVTQDQCEVCAVAYADVVQATRDLTGRHVEVISLKPRRLGDVWLDVERVGDAAGEGPRGREVAGALRRRAAAVAAQTDRLARLRLVCIEWLDPLMVAGSWMPDLAEIGGAEYDLAAPGAPSARLAWEALAAARPEVICVAPCGFTLDRTRRELGTLLGQALWPTLPAVRAGRVFAVDGHAYLNRPGPRLADSAEILAGLLHPERLGHLVPAGTTERIPAGRAATAGGAA